MKNYKSNEIRKLPLAKACGLTLERIRCAAACLMMPANMLSVTAYASETELKNTVTALAKQIYSLIVGVSTVTAAVVIAWCLFTMLLPKEERKVSAAMDWLKRALVCWVCIFLVATIMNWIIGASNGLISQNATLDNLFNIGS